MCNVVHVLDLEEILTDSVDGVRRDGEGVLEGTLVVVDASEAVPSSSVDVDADDVF